MKYQFHITQKPWADSTEIYLLARDPDRPEIRMRAMPVQFWQIKDEDSPQETQQPVLRLDGDAKQALQSLMDELWNIGVRPKDVGTAGHLAATQAHLNDFRTIVAKQLDVEFPIPKA